MVSFGKNYAVLALIIILFIQYNLLYKNLYCLVITLYSVEAFNANNEEKVDLLVHFTQYLPREKTANSINSLLNNQNISHNIPHVNIRFRDKPSDFVKVQVNNER